MTFTYTRDIPFATHTPASDQPNMQVNTNTIDDLLKVDHISFNDANGGKHNHVTFHNAQSDPTLLNSETQIYPKTFGAAATYLETFTASKTNGGSQINGYLPFVKGMAQIISTGVAGAQTIITLNTLAINIASISLGNGPLGVNTRLTVTFTVALSYATYYVFFARGLGSVIKGTGSFTSDSATYGVSGTAVEFMVI